MDLRTERAGVGGPLALGGRSVTSGIRAGFRPGSDPDGDLWDLDFNDF